MIKVMVLESETGIQIHGCNPRRERIAVGIGDGVGVDEIFFCGVQPRCGIVAGAHPRGGERENISLPRIFFSLCIATVAGSGGDAGAMVRLTYDDGAHASDSCRGQITLHKNAGETHRGAPLRRLPIAVCAAPAPLLAVRIVVITSDVRVVIVVQRLSHIGKSGVKFGVAWKRDA